MYIYIYMCMVVLSACLFYVCSCSALRNAPMPAPIRERTLHTSTTTTTTTTTTTDDNTHNNTTNNNDTTSTNNHSSDHTKTSTTNMCTNNVILASPHPREDAATSAPAHTGAGR